MRLLSGRSSPQAHCAIPTKKRCSGVRPSADLDLPLHVVFPGDIGQQRAAEIGNIFAQRKAAIDLDVIDDGVLRILVPNTSHALFELLRIGIGPPILQISFRIKLASFVVKAMRQFVADGRPVLP